MNPQVHAYILAGGHSSRFGSDKARAIVHGQPLIDRLAAALTPECVSITVVAQCSDAYQDLGLRTIADGEAHQGPLAGLLRALEDLAENMRADSIHPTESFERNIWALVISCDLVQWEPAWLASLLSSCREGTSAITFRSDHRQPFPGLYHPRLIETIRTRLQQGNGAMHALLDDPNCDSIAVDLGELPTIRCFNTQEELRRWQ